MIFSWKNNSINNFKTTLYSVKLTTFYCDEFLQIENYKSKILDKNPLNPLHLILTDLL